MIQPLEITHGVAYTHSIVPEVWAQIISETSFLNDWKRCGSVTKAALLGVNLLAVKTLNPWYCPAKIHETKFSPFKRILHLESLMIAWAKEPQHEENFVTTCIQGWRIRFQNDSSFHLPQFHYYIHQYFLTKTRPNNILCILTNEIVPGLKKLSPEKLTFETVRTNNYLFLHSQRKVLSASQDT